MFDEPRPRTPSWCAYGLLGLLCVAPLDQGGSPYPALTLLRLGTLFLFAGLMLQFFRVGAVTIPRSGVYPVIIVFMLLVAAAVLGSPYKNISVEWLLTLVMYLLVFGMTLGFFQSKPLIMRSLAILFLMGVAEASLGIAQYGWLGAGRAAGTFFNPNYLGGFLVPLIALGGACLFTTDRGLWNEMAASLRLPSGRVVPAAVVVGLLIMVVGLVVTGSRGAMLAAAVAAAAVLVASFGKRGLLVLVIALLLLAVIPNPVKDRVIEYPSKDLYAYARAEIWKSTGRIILDHPLGVGLGMFQYYWPRYNFPVEGAMARYGRWSTTPHNEYLGVAAELGLAALAVFLIGLAVYGMDVWKFLSRGASGVYAGGVYAGLAIGLGSGIVGTLTQSMVDANFHEPALALLFAFCCGALLCLRMLVMPEMQVKIALPERDRGYARFYRASIMVIALLLAVVLVRPVVAYGYAWFGDRSLRDGAIGQAVRYYDLAVLWDPGRTQYHSTLAAALFQRYHDTGEMDWTNDATFELNYARSLNPQNEEYPRRLGDVYALLAFETADPDTGEYLSQLALRYYQKAVDLNPFQPNNFLEMGKLYARSDDQETAKLMFKHALDLEPYFLPARVSLGNLYVKEGSLKKAKREYRKILAIVKVAQMREALPSPERQFFDIDAAAVKVSLEKLESRDARTGLVRN